MTSQELETIKAAMIDELEKISSIKAFRSLRRPIGVAKFLKKHASSKSHFVDKTLGPMALMAGGAGVYHFGRKYHQDRNMGRQIRMQQQMQPY